MYLSIWIIHLAVLSASTGDFYIPYDSLYDKLEIVIFIVYLIIVLPCWKYFKNLDKFESKNTAE